PAIVSRTTELRRRPAPPTTLGYLWCSYAKSSKGIRDGRVIREPNPAWVTASRPSREARQEEENTRRREQGILRSERDGWTGIKKMPRSLLLKTAAGVVSCEKHLVMTDHPRLRRFGGGLFIHGAATPPVSAVSGGEHPA